jgi:dienelactone hydrolase
VRPIAIQSGAVRLAGDLTIPQGAAGVVLFAHGSGSSRHSPRNRFVSKGLNEGGLATALLDLLTREEEIAEAHTRHLRFDIDLLAGRLEAAVDWACEQPELCEMPIGLFGASTGAAAALIAAALRPNDVKAAVSRGGRPDLAGDWLPQVRCPVMLIVGGLDSPVIELNRAAAAQLRCEARIDIIPGATHLFEEPGALEQVTELAQRWFALHLLPHPAPGAPSI